MVISDVKYPAYVEGLQLMPGPYFMRGGYDIAYFKEGNNYEQYIFNDVDTIVVADHLIEPETGYAWQTDWFDAVIYANGYRMQFELKQQSSPQYFFWSWRTVDQNGNLVGTNDIPGYNGRGSRSQATYINNTVYIKLTVNTAYSAPSGSTEPLPGTSASGFGIRAFLGSSTALNVPANGQALRCITYSNYDEVKAAYVIDVATISDFDACNNYMATHGNKIPSDYPFVVVDGLPQDYDPSRPGGGDGNYSDNSDPIDFPGLPTAGALACGAIHAFHVTSSNISDIFSKLWNTSLLDLATWQKLFSSPIECIVSLHCLPCPLVDGNSANIWFGNFNTNISAPKIANQYVTIDCGYLDILKFFGSAMDYSPYTKVSIYLPFSGIHDLKIEDVQGARVHVKYNIDILTGDCVINVKCGQSVLYKYTGNCRSQIPISSRDTTATGSAVAAVGGVISGAAHGAAIGGGAGALAGGIAAGVSGAITVALHKESVSRSGDMSGSMGMLDDFVPYLIFHRPQQSLAVNYNQFKGYPSNLTLTLGSCQGYTEVEHIHLTGIDGATDTELKEIESLLKAGVLI